MAGKNSTRKTFVKRHNDGSLWAKGTLTGGQPDGHFEWFRKDGSIMRSGYFQKGEQTGEWTTYDRKGRVVKVTHMKETQRLVKALEYPKEGPASRAGRTAKRTTSQSLHRRDKR